MKRFLSIQLVSWVLCFSIASEIIIAFHSVADFSIEMENEMEQDEEEKNIENHKKITPSKNKASLKENLSESQNLFWTSPCIDFHAPPPKKV